MTPDPTKPQPDDALTSLEQAAALPARPSSEHEAAQFHRPERTHYESHAWGGGDDGEECVACGVTWQDCDENCNAARRRHTEHTPA